ncbi:hypothetical protein SLA2020_344400 [Shorea laevis]
MIWSVFGAILCLSLPCFAIESRQLNGNGDYTLGKRWAILVAGSKGYENYRHQADVCHAYQVLRKGGLDDDNIIVFMYDDIAFSQNNPRPGIIINNPNGEDVYRGVPKDYTGENVTSSNFYAAILGNKTGLTGGSGKVVASGPDDHIFIYYADHGSTGILGMPNGDDIVAKDLMEVLKKKHDANSFKNMVIYVEACESGSMFEGLLPNNLNIYAVTASNAEESSWGTYCPGLYPSPPSEYDTCLGDIFSISWLEDSDIHDLSQETLEQQYKLVRRRTAADNLEQSSHVMQYGNLKLQRDFLFSYLGTNPVNDGFVLSSESPSSPLPSRAIRQRDAALLHFWHKLHKSPEGTQERIEARNKLNGELSHRNRIDRSINHITTVLFGDKNSTEVSMNSVPSDGQPLVHDWNCFKMLVKTFKKYCGSSTSRYEMKYTRIFANMCNEGIHMERANTTIIQACTMNYVS